MMIASLLLALASAPEWQSSFVVAPKDDRRLALRDLNGDGRRELISVGPDGFSLHPMDAEGRYPFVPTYEHAWTADRLGWDVADLDGDGRHELLVLDEGKRLLVHTLTDAGTLSEGRVLLEGLRCFLPRGRWYTSFVRDVDGDGRLDLALPGAGQFLLYMQNAEGDFEDPITVDSATRVSFDTGDPRELGGNFGQRVRIPFFRMEDVDGDGTRDLVADNGDEVAFHLATPDLSAKATWVLNLAKRRKALKKRRSVDLGDLFSNIDPQVQWKLAEIDGKAPRDLVLQEGNTFKLYMGGSARGPQGTPDHALKASGNVLHFMLRNVMGDDLPELQVIRAERISLGTAVRWLVLPGSLDFDVFTYLNDAGQIGTKPKKRTTLSLKIPRLLSLEDEFEEFGKEVEDKAKIAATVACLDGDGAFNDVVDATTGTMLVYRDVLTSEWEETSFESMTQGGVGMDDILEAIVLKDMDSLKDGGTKSLGMEDLRELKLTSGADLIEAINSKLTHESVRLKAPFDHNKRKRVLAMDLDSDGISDFVVLGESTEGETVIQLLVLKP